MRNPFRSSRATGGRPFEPAPSSEVDDELAFHLEERVRSLVAGGMSPELARQEAMGRFGDLERVRGECTALLEEDRRAEHRRDRLADLRQDIRFGLRAARRAPLFSLLAIVSIALGVGANAAVFGVMKSVLLDALPYGGADRIVRVWSRAASGTNDRLSLTAGTVAELASRVRAFERSAVFFPLPQPFAFATAAGTPHPMTAALAGPGFFETLGVRPLLGRGFSGDDLRAGSGSVVIVSHAVWSERLGRDSAIVGKTVRLNGAASTVIGVLPPTFVSPIGRVDAWVPLDLAAHLKDAIRAHRQSWLGMVARLRPGVGESSAAREVAAVGDEILRAHPDAGVASLYLMGLRDDLAGSLRTPLLVLTLSAAVVLVVTCANLAGAMLSRTLGRRQELAVRVALGAPRGRLVRQLLTESVTLSLVGGAVGVAVAACGLALLRQQAPTLLPPYADLSLDPALIGGAILLALLTGIAFGVAPAMAAVRVAPGAVLREETRGGTGGRGTSRLRGALAAAQVALCVCLLACAMLLGRSLWLLANEPLGFDHRNVLTSTVRLPASEYGTAAKQVQFADALEARVRALPGVTGVAFASALPGTLDSRDGFAIEGQPPKAPADIPFVLSASVSDGYFEAMRVTLREGRTFTSADRIGTPRVLVISESMARRWWPGRKAVGSRIRMGPDPAAPLMEIVGVVADVRNDLSTGAAEPMAYSSARQGGGAEHLLVRTSSDVTGVARLVQRELAAVDPALPLYDASTLAATLDAGLVARRVPMLLVGAFGGLALLLAAIGVYAMVANLVASRTREFGIRLALGAAPHTIGTLVLRQCGTWIAVGLAAGAAGVVVVSRLVRGMLYGIAPGDPASMAGAVALLLVAAALALYGPVRRAVRVDPIAVMH